MDIDLLQLQHQDILAILRKLKPIPFTRIRRTNKFLFHFCNHYGELGRIQVFVHKPLPLLTPQLARARDLTWYAHDVHPISVEDLQRLNGYVFRHVSTYGDEVNMAYVDYLLERKMWKRGGTLQLLWHSPGKDLMDELEPSVLLCSCVYYTCLPPELLHVPESVQKMYVKTGSYLRNWSLLRKCPFIYIDVLWHNLSNFPERPDIVGKTMKYAFKQWLQGTLERVKIVKTVGCRGEIKSLIQTILPKTIIKKVRWFSANRISMKRMRPNWKKWKGTIYATFTRGRDGKIYQPKSSKSVCSEAKNIRRRGAVCIALISALFFILGFSLFSLKFAFVSEKYRPIILKVRQPSTPKR